MTFFKLLIATGLLATLVGCSTVSKPVAGPQAGSSVPANRAVQGSQPGQGNQAAQPTQPTQESALRPNPSAADAALDSQAKSAARQDLESPEFSREYLKEYPHEYQREYQRGGASWYGPGFHGKRTASGERYDMNALTAAHRTLPFGTLVRVKSLVNGREVMVRITDRGPFVAGRILDLSRAAAADLGMLGIGFKQVVLLVPESVSGVVELPLRVVKGRGVVRRGFKVR